MKTPQNLLMILAVTQSSIGEKGSVVEVRLNHSVNDTRPDIQAEYDLASLGEVQSVRGPHGDLPRWTVTYKGTVSAKEGDFILPKG
jgi:hypothetical protein